MRSSYNGPAVLVGEDGSEHEVTVDVTITLPGAPGQRGNWAGQIHADSGLLWDSFNALQPLTLRAADGTEGSVRVFNDGRLQGVGPAPAAWLDAE